MDKPSCVSASCLLYELDEALDTLRSLCDDLKSNFESSEPEPTDPQELNRFRSIIEDFKGHLESYKKYCLACKKNGGKLKNYEKMLKEAQELLEILS